MLIVLSGGGTAGHINPALALAEALLDRGHDVVFAGTPNGLEARLVKEAGIEFVPFEAAGFNRSHPASIVKALYKIEKSTRAAKAWFNEIKPAAAVGFGGYVSIPVGRAAESLGVPFVVHEQNSVMGLANRQLSKKAAAIALTYEVPAEQLPKDAKVVLTGNPVRKEIFAAGRSEGRALLDVPDDADMLLVFGGSLGARHINTAIAGLKPQLFTRENLYIVHITGPKELEAVEAALELSAEERRRWKLYGYQDRMGAVMAASDMVVSRAGATSLAELSALGVPALLVPFPHATEDHQTANARAYVDQGAAFMVADDRVESEEFAELLFKMIDEPAVLASMRKAAASFETQDAASRLADVVIGLAKA